jgi:hypothetical protein
MRTTSSSSSSSSGGGGSSSIAPPPAMSSRQRKAPVRSAVRRFAEVGLAVAVAHTVSTGGGWYDPISGKIVGGGGGGRVGMFMVADALCPNSCSGHGTCGTDDVCHCYPDWGAIDAGSGDCSERYCPHEKAFVDFPDSSGNFHKYTECSAKGICDRSSGECQCFDGYTGKGCQRKTCPGEVEDKTGQWCSGHGSCEFLSETTFGDHPGLYYDGTVKGLDGFVTPGIHDSFGVAFREKSSRMWEAEKLMHCVCDGTWTGPDCSHRLCPRGNDVVHQRLNRADVLKNHIQNITMCVVRAVLRIGTAILCLLLRSATAPLFFYYFFYSHTLFSLVVWFLFVNN